MNTKTMELTLQEQVLVFFESLKIDLEILSFKIKEEEVPNVSSEKYDFRLKLETQSLKQFRVDFCILGGLPKTQIFYFNESNGNWISVVYKEDKEIENIQDCILQMMEGLLNLENNLE
jgi:hypothetical protein